MAQVERLVHHGVSDGDGRGAAACSIRSGVRSEQAAVQGMFASLKSGQRD